ncbi:hypothetical protein ACNQKP_03070 [Bdellovibrio bacteriovorus]|uniref:hypothetical protein n=1 Tax=Bdellovibrio bacteriovorus TaxID=959 RepID=UPI003AA8052B
MKCLLMSLVMLASAPAFADFGGTPESKDSASVMVGSGDMSDRVEKANCRVIYKVGQGLIEVYGIYDEDRRQSVGLGAGIAVNSSGVTRTKHFCTSMGLKFSYHLDDNAINLFCNSADGNVAQKVEIILDKSGKLASYSTRSTVYGRTESFSCSR